MKRGGPLRRTPLARGASTLKRSRLRAKPLEAAEAKRRAEVRGLVFARDGFRCVLADNPAAIAALGPCFGRITLHHLRKASQGGEYSVENGLTLCQAMNDAVEDNPRAAFLLGLVIRSTPLRDTIPPTP